MAMNKLRKLRGGTTTAYSMEMSEQLALFDAVKKQTDHLVSAILNSVGELNASNSPNRWERFGEVLGTYGAKGPDEKANAAMAGQKAFFDEIGRLHRLFTTQVEEQITGPLTAWTKTEYKQMHEEVKKLEKCRNTMDAATDKARKAAGNAELDAARAEAEKAYQEQLSIVGDKLNLFFTTSHKSHVGILKKFVQLQYVLFGDTSKKIQEASAAIPNI